MAWHNILLQIKDSRRPHQTRKIPQAMITGGFVNAEVGMYDENASSLYEPDEQRKSRDVGSQQNSCQYGTTGVDSVEQQWCLLPSGTGEETRCCTPDIMLDVQMHAISQWQRGGDVLDWLADITAAPLPSGGDHCQQATAPLPCMPEQRQLANSAVWSGGYDGECLRTQSADSSIPPDLDWLSSHEAYDFQGHSPPPSQDSPASISIQQLPTIGTFCKQTAPPCDKCFNQLSGGGCYCHHAQPYSGGGYNRQAQPCIGDRVNYLQHELSNGYANAEENTYTSSSSASSLKDYHHNSSQGSIGFESMPHEAHRQHASEFSFTDDGSSIAEPTSGDEYAPMGVDNNELRLLTQVLHSMADRRSSDSDGFDKCSSHDSYGGISLGGFRNCYLATDIYSQQGDASAPYGKKHYGRVRDNVKKGNQKKVVLWEFIRGLLLNGNTTIIKWENKQEGVFRIINSQKVAQLWGKHKQNPAMNYDKLARAMRNYYKRSILQHVRKSGRYPKKLVYQFGLNAHGWQTD